MILLNNKYILYLIINLKLRKNMSFHGMPWEYVVLLSLMNFVLIISSDIIFIIIVYIFFFCYKFLILNVYIFLNKKIFLIMAAILLSIFCFSVIKILISLLFAIDFYICTKNLNEEYNCAFMGFSEDLFEIKLTNRGKTKVTHYMCSLIMNNENKYIMDHLRDKSDSLTEYDLIYKNPMDIYR